MFLNSLLASYAFDTAETVVLWLTVAILAALIIAGAVVFFVKRPVTGKFVKYGVIAFVGYALVMGIIMLSLQLAKRTDPAYLEEKWLNAEVVNLVLVPLLVLFGATLLSGVALFVISGKKPSVFRLCAIILGAVLGAGVVAAAVTIGIYFSHAISDDGYYSEFLDQTALYISAAALAVAAVVGAVLLDGKGKKGFDSKSIALAGVCVAMSFVLSYVKLWDMPQGGSVTLVSMLPVMLYGYVYGAKKGVLVGFIYGLMQAMQDPYIVHPAQFLLDYPLAFAMLGFAGAFKNLKVLKYPQVKFGLGALLAGSLRFVAHLLAGVFSFGATAAELGFDSFWLYSAGYNSFVFIDVALVLVAGVAVLSSKSFVKQLESYAASGKKPSTIAPATEAAASEDGADNDSETAVEASAETVAETAAADSETEK